MKQGKILVIGSSNTDMTVKVKRLPHPGETVLGTSFLMGAGGKGANQAVAAKRLGGDVSFVCKVGCDIFGDNSIGHYRAEGLSTDGILRSTLPSGIALIPVDEEAENSIVVASGANMDFSPGDILSCMGEIASCEILLMQLEIPVPTVLEAAYLAHSGGKCVVLNPAPAEELPEEMFQHARWIILNETELSQYSGMSVEDADSACLAATRMREKGAGNIIITLGGKGSLVIGADGQCVRIPAFKVDAVDTTGAGDTFCGAFCVALSEGKTPRDAAVFASAASALTVLRSGAQGAIPFREEVEQFLSSQQVQASS